MTEITASSNGKYKYVKSLSLKKARKKYGEYTIEGIKSVGDALKSDRKVTAVYVSDSFYKNESFAYPVNIPLYKVSDDLFAKMCDTKTPQGILAVVKIETDNEFTADLSKKYIYCDNVSDPGNLGTIIRTADAAGFDAVLLSEGCADLYSPKTVRASMGSFFNMRTVENVTADMLRAYCDMGFSLIGGALSQDSADYRDTDMTKPCIIAVGNEANGIREEILKICSHVKIPILGKAESLNAAVAAAILMYELVRQRS